MQVSDPAMQTLTPEHRETIQLMCIARLVMEFENNTGQGLAMQFINTCQENFTPEQTYQIAQYSFLNGVKAVMLDYLKQTNIFDPVTSHEWKTPNENNPMQKL